MYVEIDDQRIKCGTHGRSIGVVHLYVEGGDIDNPQHGWLVCRACAERMDRDPRFKERSRSAFDDYQANIREVMRQEGYGV